MTIFLSLLLVVAIAGLIHLGLRLFRAYQRIDRLEFKIDQTERSNAKKVDGLEAHILELTNYANDMHARAKRLSVYQGIADAEARAQAATASAQAQLASAREQSNQIVATAQVQARALVAEAQQRLDAAKSQAEQWTEQAQAESRKIVGEGREKARSLKDEAVAGLTAATSKAAQIVADAEMKAEQIAGDAYAALKNAAMYEQTVKAMKNLIQGYGDRYLVPPQSLLDELAEHFSHKEAGQNLKRAREHTLLMVKNGTAGACDYVEENRRQTAVNFVVDAFNGKVDSVLSRVKEDNVGTLQQEIRDAHTLVNFNGKAFRDACIREEYLNARLDELEWASVVQQLKLEEREEQRRIKEQIREEEKARKEYERARREAEREQEIIRKALEKARAQLEHATAQQRETYERQMLELQQRLTEAEGKNQRALSMAQQTRRGHVYIISNIGSFGENVYKIGLTRRLEPRDRIRELGDSSVPFEFDIHGLIPSEDAPALEHKLHKHFMMMQLNKVNHRKEFFRVDLAHVRQEIEAIGLTTNWTMAAEARQFRESLAIERKIKEDPAAREAWLRRQLELEYDESTKPPEEDGEMPFE